MNIGHFAVESDAQTSSPSHESESEGLSPSPSHQKSDSSRTRVRVGLESYKSAFTLGHNKLRHSGVATWGDSNPRPMDLPILILVKKRKDQK